MHIKTIFKKDFILVVLGQIISIFGNQILRYAIPLYLLNTTGSSALFGTILAISFIPMILMFPIGGIIADRVNKKNIMVVLDFSTAILVLFFYLSVGRIDIVPLITITMVILYGIQGAYQPAVKASIPFLVDSENIITANAIVDVINSSASVAGPVIGGLLFSFMGLVPILFVSIVCFLASAIMEIYIYIPFERRIITDNIIMTSVNDIKESFKFMFKERSILGKVSLIFASSNLLLTSLTLIALPVLITQYLGFNLDVGNRLYGYAQGVVAIGAVVGGLLAGILSKKLWPKSSPFILISCALPILIEGVVLRSVNNTLIIYILLIMGSGLLLAFHTLFQVQIMSYLQLLTPNHLIGKVISCFIGIVMCTIPLGQLMYGCIFEYLGEKVYLLFYISSFVMIGISVFTRGIFNNLDNLLVANKKE